MNKNYSTDPRVGEIMEAFNKVKQDILDKKENIKPENKLKDIASHFAQLNTKEVVELFTIIDRLQSGNNYEYVKNSYTIHNPKSDFDFNNFHYSYKIYDEYHSLDDITRKFEQHKNPSQIGRINKDIFDILDNGDQAELLSKMSYGEYASQLPHFASSKDYNSVNKFVETLKLDHNKIIDDLKTTQQTTFKILLCAGYSDTVRFFIKITYENLLTNKDKGIIIKSSLHCIDTNKNRFNGSYQTVSFTKKKLLDLL